MLSPRNVGINRWRRVVKEFGNKPGRFKTFHPEKILSNCTHHTWPKQRIRFGCFKIDIKFPNHLNINRIGEQDEIYFYNIIVKVIGI